MNENFALSVQKVELYFESIKPIVDKWKSRFPDVFVSSNLYLTRPNCGLPFHEDPHHVFALQIHGSKRWDLKTEVYTTEPGDILYIPRYMTHKARTVGDRSIHISIGVDKKPFD